jgi:hypothetical protein
MSDHVIDPLSFYDRSALRRELDEALDAISKRRAHARKRDGKAVRAGFVALKRLGESLNSHRLTGGVRALPAGDSEEERIAVDVLQLACSVARAGLISGEFCIDQERPSQEQERAGHIYARDGSRLNDHVRSMLKSAPADFNGLCDAMRRCLGSLLAPQTTPPAPNRPVVNPPQEDEAVGAEETPRQDNSKGPSRTPRFDRWAMGWEAVKGRWILFKQDGGRLREHKWIQGINKGMQHHLLMAFAEGNSQLSLKVAQRVAGRNHPCPSDLVKPRVKPELSHVKKVILAAMGPDYANAVSPFEYDDLIKGWVSNLSIGYVTDTDGTLCFRLHEQL